MKISERDIERTCTDLLALDGWRCLKTDPVSRREWGKGFGEKGMADCLYIRYDPPCSSHPHRLQALRDALTCARPDAQIIWIEWKAPRGTVANHQTLWHAAERNRGALTLIAGQDFPASIDGFLEWYRGSGLMRKKI